MILSQRDGDHTQAALKSTDFKVVCFSAAAVGVMLSASWLSSNLFAISFLGFSFLIFECARLTALRSFVFGWFAGSIALGIAFHWAPQCVESSTHLDINWAIAVYVAMVAWDALIFAIFAVLVSHVSRRCSAFIWFAPAYWVALEYLWPRLFPWAIAHSQSDVVAILQVAEYAGTGGVSALVVLAATSTAMLIHSLRDHAHWRCPLAGLVFVVFAMVWGQYRSHQVDAEVATCRQLKIGAVQVDPTYVGAVEKMRELSLSISETVDLIVWPETSLGHYHESLDTFADPIKTGRWSELPNPAGDPSDGFSVPLLAGGKTYADGGRDEGPYRNTAFLIDVDKAIVGRYVKRTLMPIGEYVPGESWWPQARDWAAIELPLVQGTSATPLAMPSPRDVGAKLGVLICFEDMNRENARSTVLSGAECLIALVNGSEFEDVDALVQHQRLAMLRSVENRRALLRCASTGITSYITPTGRIEATLSPQRDDVMVVSIPLIDQTTFYTRFGEWFSWLCIAITILSFIASRGRWRGLATLRFVCLIFHSISIGSMSMTYCTSSFSAMVKVSRPRRIVSPRCAASTD